MASAFTLASAQNMAVPYTTHYFHARRTHSRRRRCARELLTGNAVSCRQVGQSGPVGSSDILVTVVVNDD